MATALLVVVEIGDAAVRVVGRVAEALHHAVRVVPRAIGMARPAPRADGLVRDGRGGRSAPAAAGSREGPAGLRAPPIKVVTGRAYERKIFSDLEKLRYSRR